jgi:methylglutaconyl-CoA hydratase
LVGACDIAVANRDVTFALTEVRIGVVAAVISAVLLRRMPPRPAQELFLTGDTFDATRAVEVGLLTAAVPAGQLDAEVRRYTDMLAKGAPNALAATKQLLHAARPHSLSEDLAAMQVVSARHFGSEEGREGLSAFAEKRAPRWLPDG